MMIKKTAAILLSMILLLPLSYIAIAAENAETPVISSQPSGVTVLVNEAADLSVTANVTVGILSYQWYSNDVNDNATGTSIAGATASSYSAPTGTAGTKYYYCIVTNTDDEATIDTTTEVTTNTAAVVVNEAIDAETPAIDTQPAGTTVLVGETADLSVTASVGAGTLSYQWYSNTVDSNAGGTLISGATNTTYSAPTASAGTTYYYCIVTNTDNTATGNTTATATTDTAAVIVNEAIDAETPAIDTQPTGTTVLVGETADLSVTASVGTGTLSYQWYSNAVDSNTGGALISGATNTTYSAPTGSTGTTYYYCVVTNTDNTATGNTTATATTDTAAVIVNEAIDAETPAIDTQPAGTTVLVGETADLSVTASVSAGTLSYQWYSNAVDSNTGGALISGATNASYSAPTGSTGTTYYYCVVTNTDNTATGNTTATATTDTAAVIVNEAIDAETPAIDTQPAGTTVLVGETADLSVTASVGAGTLSYQWYSNTVDSNAGGALISGATNASYSAPTGSAGTTYYYCIVTNTDNTATGNTTATATTDTAAVIVNEAIDAETPAIDTQPAGTTVLVGETADLSVTASVGAGTLSYQWYSNATDSNTGGALISGATNASYSAPTASAGTTYYYCVVTNTDNTATGNTTATATTDTAAVIVNEAIDAETPAIDTQPAGTTVLIGETADLSVTASVGTGTLSYQWYSNATDSNTGGALISGATNTTYSAPTGSTGTTYYYCIVTNTDNTATGNTTATATTDTAAVIVNEAIDAETPAIDTQPAGTTVLVGETADLSVTASVGAGTLSYQWYNNTVNSNAGGTLIAGATNASYSAPTASTGTTYYYCIVTNTDNTVPGNTTATATTDTAAVVVNTRTASSSTPVPRPAYAETPVILSQPADTSVPVGEPVTLSVSASVTTGTLSYQWYRNSGAIPGAGSASYAVPTSVAGTAYYFCVITNTDPGARETTATAASRAAAVTVKIAVTMVNEPLNTDDTAPDETKDHESDGSDSSTEVDLYESTVLTQDEINDLIIQNETEPVELKGQGYTMTFPVGTMTATDFEEIDFGARLSDGSDFPEIAAASGGHPILIASFNHSGKLPGEALITFHAGAEYAGQTLYYYYYNHETGELEFRQSALVDNEGNIMVTQSSCSDYVLTETRIDEETGSDVPVEEAFATPVAEEAGDTVAENMPKTDNGFPWVYFLIGGLLLIAIVLIIGIARRRR